MSTDINGLKNKGYFVAHLDGKSNTTKKAFLENIGKAFNFPDYYGQNLDALEECIGDLSWIMEDDFALGIDHSADLLSEDADTKKIVLSILKESTSNWKEEGSDFKVVMN